MVRAVSVQVRACLKIYFPDLYAPVVYFVLAEWKGI